MFGVWARDLSLIWVSIRGRRARSSSGRREMDHTAEIFDQIQMLYKTNGFNDHVLHSVLSFERGPDPEVLNKSVIASIEAIPVLGARYIDGATPRWEGLEPEQFGRAFVLATTNSELEEFLLSPVDEAIGPQIRVCQLELEPFRDRAENEPHDLRCRRFQAILISPV